MTSMIETAANDNGDAAQAKLMAAFRRALDEQLGTEGGVWQVVDWAHFNSVARFYRVR